MSDSVIVQNYSNKYYVLSMYAKSENQSHAFGWCVCIYVDKQEWMNFTYQL